MGVAQHSLHRINSCTETSSPSLIMPKGSGLTKPMKLSADLADIVGKKEASRAECIKQLWAYIKKHNLQDPENKQYFTPDKKMAKVRRRPHPRLRHGQVPLSPPLLIYFPFLLPKNQMKRNFTRPDFSFPCVQNDIQHSCLIRPTIDSPLPSSNSPSLLEMPSPRTAELTTEPFSRLRDEPQSSVAFSRGGDFGDPLRHRNVVLLRSITKID